MSLRSLAASLRLGRLTAFVVLAVLLAGVPASALAAPTFQEGRTLSGVLVTNKAERAPRVRLTVRTTAGEQTIESDAEGYFSATVPPGAVAVTVGGENVVERTVSFDADRDLSGVSLVVEYVVPPINESVVIVDNTIEPAVERRDEAIYRDTLFSRDDQVFHTLNAGINAGQHEGGGKSLEIRRFGFNLDHGGVNGGLKVLVDDVQQNHGTQGHGQGYLGQLKSLTPELVEDVTILNGPFSALYGDFSGLGVVQIRLKESLPDQFTVRLQGGSFDTYRGFFAYSPNLERDEALITYELSRTNGPFLNPLEYERDNVNANYTWKVDKTQAVGFKLNYGRNDYVSSGQIPLDLVFANELDRFGFVDPDNGGRVDQGVAGIYYRKELASGDLFKIDGVVGRSLFDHFIDFTFFLNDPVNGDEVQQHDSRLYQGVNAQYIKPYEFAGTRALLTFGSNFLANQIDVGLWRSRARDPFETVTQAHARVTNGAAFAHQALDLAGGHVHLEGGLRYDAFRFRVDDKIEPAFSGSRSAGRWQPKASAAFLVADRVPLTLHLNYGRGIASQDARGVVQQPDGPKIATTDFYQTGASYNVRRFSLATDLFLIDTSNQQVYIPDDGSIEFAGPSRAYGYEVKGSIELAKRVSLNGGLTRVTNAFFRGTSPRVYVDSAPHVVANAALTLNDWRGYSGSLRYRHISNYRLDGEDASIRAAGHDVLDFSMVKRLRRWADLNFAIDNVTNKRYFETQNFYESRVSPTAPVVERIHATPGYPFTLTAGLTFRFGSKD